MFVLVAYLLKLFCTVLLCLSEGMMSVKVNEVILMMWRWHRGTQDSGSQAEEVSDDCL